MKHVTLRDRPVKVPIKSAAVVRSWKKFVVCGCSHGELADPSALNEIVKFNSDFKPDKRIHLGDFCDTTAWRGGAKGTKDEGACVADDIGAGLTFLERYEPTLVFNGNHEARLYRFAKSPSALLSHAALVTIDSIRETIIEQLGAEYVEDYSLETGWRRLGNFLVGHGYKHNTHAVKSHADIMGNCMIAHLHRQEVLQGTRADRPTGICVGYLGQRDKFTYAETWESRYRWNVGWCYGEYTENQTVWNLKTLRTECDNKPFSPV